jgi:hypothetical protein
MESYDKATNSETVELIVDASSWNQGLSPDWRKPIEDRRRAILQERLKALRVTDKFVQHGRLVFTARCARFQIESTHNTKTGSLIGENTGSSLEEHIALFRIKHNSMWGVSALSSSFPGHLEEARLRENSSFCLATAYNGPP